MKHILHLAVLLAATLLTPSAHADEVRACQFELKSRCVSVDASVTLADRSLKSVEVFVIWCGQQGRPAYTCTLDLSRDGADLTWSDDAGATQIANNAPMNPAEPDTVTVTVGKHVSIDLEKAQSLGRCGAGAALPRAIVIPAQGGACRVWLGNP